MTHSCKYCKKEFGKGTSLGAHVTHCAGNPNRSRTIEKITKSQLKLKVAVFSKSARDKASNTVILNGTFAGRNNLNWKGGESDFYRIGWKRLRRQVRERDILCRVCGKLPEKGRKLDVHHVISRRNNGKNTLENLVAVHRSCHIKLEFGKAKIVGM